MLVWDRRLKTAEPAIKPSSNAPSVLSQVPLTRPIGVAGYMNIQPAKPQQATQEGRSPAGDPSWQVHKNVDVAYRVEGSASSQGQTFSGGEGYKPLTFGGASGQHREASPASAIFDRLDAPVDLATPGTLSTDTGVTTSSAKQPVDQVIAAVVERVESTRSKGRTEASFEIHTDDGSAINVKITVHRNAVWTRIGVSTAEMRDTLASRAWELGQRLESGGLVPESIEVVLLGGWSGSPQDEGQRRPAKQKPNHTISRDFIGTTMVEVERPVFEHWA